MDKYKYCMYQKGYFCGVSNVDLNPIRCEDKIVIPSMIKSYVLHWYHVYLLNPGMDRTEIMVGQHFTVPA